MWWMKKRIKEAWEKGLHQGYKAGYRTGELHTLLRILYYYGKLMNEDQKSLVERQIAEILAKAEKDGHRGG